MSSFFRRGLAAACLIALTSTARAQNTPTTFPSVDSLPEIHDLPDPFVMNDGQRVTTPQQWQARRAEMRKMIEYYLTGTMPPPPGNVTGDVLDDRLLADDSIRFRRVKLIFGPGKKLSFEIGLFLPTTGAGPFPTVINISFNPTPGAPLPPTTTPATSTTQIAIFEKMKNARIPENAAKGVIADAVKRGYVVIQYNYQQCGADNRKDCKSTGFFSAYPEYDWGDIGAWAWSMSRVVDYVQSVPEIDSKKLIALGHSRLGKTTLVAGAFDDRFAMVAPAGSGCAGTGAFRFNGPGRGDKQGIEDFATRFDYQLGPRMPQFIDHVYKLPFDQHWLIAMCAPRPFMAAEGLDDGACNGKATKHAILGAQPVFDFLQVSDNLGIHFRPGKHMLAPEDWKAVLDFADIHLRGMKVEGDFKTFPADELLH